MKRIIYGIIIILICGFMIGCGNKKDGSTFEISLDENASTGYQWKKKIKKNGIVDLTFKSDYSNCEKNVDGCSGKRIYTLKALKSGTVRLTLTYSFINDNTNKTTKTAIYEIKVDDDLNISETHSGSYFDN